MNDDDDDQIIIHLKDVYKEVIKIREQMSALTESVKKVRWHEKRIRSLERWRYTLPATLGASISGLILAITGRK